MMQKESADIGWFKKDQKPFLDLNNQCAQNNRFIGMITQMENVIRMIIIIIIIISSSSNDIFIIIIITTITSIIIIIIIIIIITIRAAYC